MKTYNKWNLKTKKGASVHSELEKLGSKMKIKNKMSYMPKQYNIKYRYLGGKRKIHWREYSSRILLHKMVWKTGTIFPKEWRDKNKTEYFTENYPTKIIKDPLQKSL